MVDPATLPVTAERQIALEAAELDLLLHDWLSELIFLKDRDRAVFPECRVRVEGAGPWRLTATVRGGPIDPGRTALGADPKAVTFHQFALERAGKGWRARVVIDI
jgi:SHS2 domain-containing protein